MALASLRNIKEILTYPFAQNFCQDPRKYILHKKYNRIYINVYIYNLTDRQGLRMTKNDNESVTSHYSPNQRNEYSNNALLIHILILKVASLFANYDINNDIPIQEAKYLKFE